MSDAMRRLEPAQSKPRRTQYRQQQEGKPADRTNQSTVLYPHVRRLVLPDGISQDQWARIPNGNGIRRVSPAAGVGDTSRAPALELEVRVSERPTPATPPAAPDNHLGEPGGVVPDARHYTRIPDLRLGPEPGLPPAQLHSRNTALRTVKCCGASHVADEKTLSAWA